MKMYIASWKKRSYLLVISSIIFVLLAGCSGGIKQQSIVKPFLTGLEGWPEMYRQNFQSMNSLTGKARVTIESVQLSGNINADIAWVRPDQLFIQVEGPLGIDVGQTYVGSSRFIVYNQHENHFTAGNINDPYLNRIWLTNFTLKDLKYAALGYAIQAEMPLQLVDEFHGVFSTQNDDIEYRFIVNPESGLLERCESIRENKVFMQQEFKNYKVVNGFYIPQLIQITLVDQKERISIFYNEMEINKPIDPAKLVIQIGPKVEQLNLN